MLNFHFSSWQAFWHMGGYATYVWTAYAGSALVLIGQIYFVSRKK